MINYQKIYFYIFYFDIIVYFEIKKKYIYKILKYNSELFVANMKVFCLQFLKPKRDCGDLTCIDGNSDKKNITRDSSFLGEV